MKRSKYLVPLSWEHHNALLNANRLQKGIANRTETRILLEFANFIWQNDLFPHFQREENIIMTRQEWPNIPEHLRTRVLQEHQTMEGMVKRLNNLSDEDEIKRLLNELASMVIGHVRFEERELFPAIEESFFKQSLQKIEQALREAHVPGCTVWNPKFWERKQSKKP
ncbi:hemerythrin domain-containing protein [Calditrichota bacterium GD2]